ncbi:MAG: HAMP domain-containing protein [Anaerolineae bacterium]|nr:HAMP domain-containing protein [Anaerolineae bacterium]
MLKNILDGDLRTKVTLGVVLPLLLILGTFAIIEHIRHQDVALENLSLLAAYSGRIIESNLRHAMMKDDFTEVQNLLDTIGTSDQFRTVYVLDPTGKVIFAPYRDGVGLHLDQRDPECQTCHSRPPAERPINIVINREEGQRVFRSMYPLENQPECAECHKTEQRFLGLLVTDISMTPIESALATDVQENFLWWMVSILITILVVNIVISKFVLSRLKGLANAIERLGQGHLPRPLAEGQSDEIGQLATAFNLMVRQIETRNRENAELSEQLSQQSAQRGELLKRLITVQENERTRVARELHDDLGQSLSGLALCMEALESMIKTDVQRAHAQMAQIRNLVAATTDQMYDLILDLRPSALDDLGIVVALRSHMERTLGSAGIGCELVTEGLRGRLPSAIETTLYRIFQEALSNIIRHSQAQRVVIRLIQHENRLEGTIADDGVGFDLANVQTDGSSPRGLGLMGIQERVTQCGGQVEISSRVGEGTYLKVCIPLMEGMFCDG